MFWITTKQDEAANQRQCKLRHRVRLWYAAALGLMLAAGSAHGALITPISARDVPVFNTAILLNLLSAELIAS